MVAKYQVYKDVAGKFRFRLRAENNKIVAVSEGYEQHAGCLNGVRSVKSNCDAEIEDLTIEGTRISNPKYQIFYDAKCGYRFHLTARNGELIAQSEGYQTKEGALNGINAVRTSCNAEIEDLTATKIPDSDETKMETIATATTVETKMPATEIEGSTVTLMPESTETKIETATATTVDISVPTGEIRDSPVTLMPETTETKKETGLETEMPPAEGTKTKLELFNLPERISKGEVLFFKGRLSRSDGEGIPKAKISIREHDRSFMMDEVLAFEYTKEDGSFDIGWKARSVDFWDDTAEIYAQYDGDNRSHIRSNIQKIEIK